MICTHRSPILPSPEWRRLFLLEGPWIVDGGTFETLEVSPPDFAPANSESRADDGRDEPQPTVTIKVRSAGLGVELFLPMPEHRQPRLLQQLRQTRFMCGDDQAWWLKRCASQQEVMQTVNALFAILQSLWTRRVCRPAVVVPELIDLANIIHRRFPRWLDERSRPFGFLELNVNGVSWVVLYDSAQGTYSMDCMGYCDTWNGTTHACGGPCRVPRWLFSRCLGMAEVSLEYDETDWASSVTVRDPRQLIEILASLQFRLQADLVTRLIDIDP